MKNISTVLIVLLLLIAVTGSSEHELKYPDKGCRRDYLATAEPGTCFNPKAYRLLQAIEKVRDRPDLYENNKKFFSIFEPRINCVKDTMVSRGDFSVPLRIYYPDKACQRMPYPVVFYIHGGAFMYGSIDDYDMLAKKIARTTQSIVTSVEYRLAPDHPFPVGIEDSYCALQWVSDHLNEIGGKENGLFLMGSSAGANIATVLCMLCLEDGKPDISGQILYYPPTTFLDTEFPSRLLFLKDTARNYFLTEALLRKCKACYMGDFNNEKDPRLSPLEAELSPHLPAALVITAQCDPLRDEGKLYAQKLAQAGVYVQNREYEGMIHGFLSFYMVLKDANRSLLVCKDFIRGQLDES